VVRRTRDALRAALVRHGRLRGSQGRIARQLNQPLIYTKCRVSLLVPNTICSMCNAVGKCTSQIIERFKIQSRWEHPFGTNYWRQFPVTVELSRRLNTYDEHFYSDIIICSGSKEFHSRPIYNLPLLCNLLNPLCTEHKINALNSQILSPQLRESPWVWNRCFTIQQVSPHVTNFLLLTMLFLWLWRRVDSWGRYQRFRETYCLHLQGWSGDAGK
jgi:hypothetical protein